jgi:hypothetical protein
LNILLKRLADNTKATSFATQLRQKRFQFFLDLLTTVPRPVTILDVGGTQVFWEMMGFVDLLGIHITLLNLHKQEVSHTNFEAIVGDATNLVDIKTNQFDVVFSNSVIEHVGNYDQQRRMAQEIQRVGKRFFVQTPNYYFPIEPHFLFVGFQWLPVSTRAWLINHFNLGWIKRVPDPTEARECVEQIRLLRKHDFQALFPGAHLYEEKVIGLTKSFVLYNDW